MRSRADRVLIKLPDSEDVIHPFPEVFQVGKTRIP